MVTVRRFLPERREVELLSPLPVEECQRRLAAQGSLASTRLLGFGRLGIRLTGHHFEVVKSSPFSTMVPTHTGLLAPARGGTRVRVTSGDAGVWVFALLPAIIGLVNAAFWLISGAVGLAQGEPGSGWFLLVALAIAAACAAATVGVAAWVRASAAGELGRVVASLARLLDAATVQAPAPG